MNGKFLYLSLDLLSLIFPLAFSFHPKNNFFRKWKYLFTAIILPASVFIVWDSFFTKAGVWGFNPAYITGIYFFNLPLEEILFFFCVPYACVFTYYSVNLIAKRDIIRPKAVSIISGILIAGLFVLGVIFRDRAYTVVTFVATSLFIYVIRRKLNPAYLGRFYFAFIFILIPFFIVNGILTGTAIASPVVWYNNGATLGIRMGTIPVEDTFYGMLLILMNVVIFEELQKKS